MDFARGVQKTLNARGISEIDWYRRAQDRDEWRLRVVYGIPDGTKIETKKGKNKISREVAYTARNKNIDKAKEDVSKPNKEGEWKCPVELCGKVYKTHRGFVSHYRQKHGAEARELEDAGGSYKCDKCPAEFKSKGWLKAHIREMHEIDPKERTCSICRKECKSRRDLQNHMKTHRQPEQDQ